LNDKPEDSEKTIVCDVAMTLGEWETGDILSNYSYPKSTSGAFGSVFYGEEKITRRPVAIKIVEVSMDKTVSYNGINSKEAALLKKIPWHRLGRSISNQWIFVFEYHGYGQDKPKSTLRHYLRDVARSRGKQGLTENEAKKIMCQLLSACNHLERHGITTVI
ncbi:9130_t:CDS:2, partial [Paraglomus brasilianum]